IMEAVALDWEKVGIKVRRVPEMFSNFLPKNRTRKTNKTHWLYGAPPFDEPSLAWQRCCHVKGAFALLNEGLYEKEIDATVAEMDADKRAKMTQALGQKLYDNYHGVMIGMKTVTWAVSKKVKSWDTLVYVPLENNYEDVSVIPAQLDGQHALLSVPDRTLV